MLQRVKTSLAVAVMVTVTAALSVPSYAGVIAGSTTLGNGNTVIDEGTGQEWLNLNATQGLSIYEIYGVSNIGNPVAEADQFNDLIKNSDYGTSAFTPNAISGGLFDGWRLATLDEVQTLFNNAVAADGGLADEAGQAAVCYSPIGREMGFGTASSPPIPSPGGWHTGSTSRLFRPRG